MRNPRCYHSLKTRPPRFFVALDHHAVADVVTAADGSHHLAITAKSEIEIAWEGCGLLHEGSEADSENYRADSLRLLKGGVVHVAEANGTMPASKARLIRNHPSPTGGGSKGVSITESQSKANFAQNSGAWNRIHSRNFASSSGGELRL